MDRRNFIGALLTIGAGFSILPGAGRLWVPERTIILPDHEVRSIWETHYVSWADSQVPVWTPGWDGLCGKLMKCGDRIWIKSAWGELPLKKMRRPLGWRAHPESIEFYSGVINHRWNNNTPHEHIVSVQPTSVDGGSTT